MTEENFWQDLFYKYNEHQLYDDFKKLKEETSKVCIDCGAHCCNGTQHRGIHTAREPITRWRQFRNQMGTLFSAKERAVSKMNQFLPEKIWFTKSSCFFLEENRCVVEQFKPAVCIRHFCAKVMLPMDKKQREIVDTFRRELERLLIKEENRISSLRELNSPFEYYAIERWLEEHPILYKRYMRHINNKIHSMLLYPPRVYDDTPKSGQIPLWEVD